jgi:hypothetical protein
MASNFERILFQLMGFGKSAALKPAFAPAMAGEWLRRMVM